MIVSNKQIQNILQLDRVNSSKKKSPLKESTEVSKNDSLVLSSRAQELNFVKEQVLKSPAVRADKIRDLKKQIEEGSYQVSGSDVAAKMLNQNLMDDFTGR